MGNKQRNKTIRQKYELKQEMEKYPEYCYCEETLGLEPDIDYENDKPIGMTETADGFPYWNSTGYTVPIYLCKRCNKKHIVKIAY
jgi:hypothetical protein